MKYCRHPSVYWKTIKGGVVLLEHNKAFIRELNAVGSLIWQAIGSPRSQDAITEQVCAVFDVEKNQAGNDVEEFLREYLRLGLVQEISLPRKLRSVISHTSYRCDASPLLK